LYLRKAYLIYGILTSLAINTANEGDGRRHSSAQAAASGTLQRCAIVALPAMENEVSTNPQLLPDSTDGLE
jgi:hypothetical protein